MNTRFLILSLAGLLSPCALAEPPEPIATTTVKCSSENWPTRGQVARYLHTPQVKVGELEGQAQGRIAREADTAAIDEAERTTQYIRKEGRRECWRGASHVRVDFHARPDRSVAVLMHPRKAP